mgnify:CR=1 FL=1
MTELEKLDSQYIANTYARFPVDIVSGKGSLIYDSEGKEYIDMGTGIAVNSFGIADDIWKKAVIEQLDRIQHTSNLYYTQPCVELAQLLCEKTGMKKVFFSNSGAEANEGAIKAAIKYAYNKDGSVCNFVVCNADNIELLGTSSSYNFAIDKIVFDSETSAGEIKTALSPECSDIIKDINRIAIATLKECMQTVYEDGPKRDRRLWLGDLRLCCGTSGAFPDIAPWPPQGFDTSAATGSAGWADAGVIVPYQVWKQFGDAEIVEENWAAMERFMTRVAETKYRTENLPESNFHQFNDWLSLTRMESCPCKPEYGVYEPGPIRKRRPGVLTYWNYLGGCYWLWDAGMMAEMAAATGRLADAEKYRRMAATAREYVKREFFSVDGTVFFRGMQTPVLFALKFGLVEGSAREAAVADLRASIAACGGTLHTGFLGTSIVMDALTENGLVDMAYALLFNRKFPGWLYSVDQGATTIWERWNSYTKESGFGPVGMNSFNHYAYGSVLAWMYKTVAGIAADPNRPGFRNVVMAPVPDRRLGWVKAEYKSAAGLVRSAWRYEGERWIWEFTVPRGATATVTVPGGVPTAYGAGSYVRELSASDLERARSERKIEFENRD